MKRNILRGKYLTRSRVKHLLGSKDERKFTPVSGVGGFVFHEETCWFVAWAFHFPLAWSLKPYYINTYARNPWTTRQDIQAGDGCPSEFCQSGLHA